MTFEEQRAAIDAAHEARVKASNEQRDAERLALETARRNRLTAACLAAHQERERARSCERALSAAMSEQAQLIAQLAKSDCDLEQMIRAVAAAAVPPTFPSDQSKVFISVPGPRTPQ